MKIAPLTVFNFSIKNQGNSSVDIFIDGDIVDAPTQEFLKAYLGDDTSTSYKSFRDMMNKIDASTYNVYINSGGGQVTEAMAIHDLLQELQTNGKTVNTIGRGIIASSATYILMASKNPSMSANSWLMIHNVSGFCYGSVTECESYVATMRKFNDSANQFYQNVTGLSKTVIGNMMDAETWLTADEAKAKGFVKNVSGEVSFSNAIKPDQWQFTNTSVLNSYNSFIQKNNPVMDNTKTISEAITNGFNTLLEKLGISNKKEDATTKNALSEFTKSITDSIENASKDNKPMDEAAIKTLITNQITEVLKTVPENFTKAITDSQKDFVVKNDLKDLLNKTDMKKEMDDLKENISNIVAGKTKNEKKEVKNEKKVGNKWAYENLWPAEN